MKLHMEPEWIAINERKYTGTSWTRNETLEQMGHFVMKKLWNPRDLYSPPPPMPNNGKGIELSYKSKKLNDYVIIEKEDQVPGSFARYHHPQYREIHAGIQPKIEQAIGRKLYRTYYYERFYYPGQDLSCHVDRDACEISVTMHINSNLSIPWPIYVKSPDTYSDASKTEIVKFGKSFSAILQPGDGMIYKGCERPHWRNPMPREYEKTWYGGKIEKSGLYYHQIFFHYVLADGCRSHFAGDFCKKGS
jgi:hypothetical protein